MPTSLTLFVATLEGFDKTSRGEKLSTKEKKNQPNTIQQEEGGRRKGWRVFGTRLVLGKMVPAIRIERMTSVKYSECSLSNSLGLASLY